MTSTISTDRPRQVRASQTGRLDVVVIGGGQAGLAAGYYLARQGLGFVILDAHDRIGDAWRNRWDSLTLFTPAKLSSLPGMAIPGPRYNFPTKNEIADYLESYARTMDLPVRTGVEVRRASRSGDGWTIDTTSGNLSAESVIIATGGYQSPNIPTWAADLDSDIVQLHSSEYRNPSQLQPGSVLVAGASHSGVDIAIEAARNHPTTLVGRDTGQVPLPTTGPLVPFTAPLIWFALNHVVTVDTPIGRKAKRQFRNHGFPLEHPTRDDVLAAGVERIVERATGAQDGRPVLADGRVLDVRNVVWCTGFHGDYSWIDGVTYGDDGYPEQDHGVASNAQGLYFLGLKFQRAGSSSLIGGVGRDASQVVGHIAARVSSAA